MALTYALGAEMLVLGGRAPEYLRHNARVLDIVREFRDQGLWVFAICHGIQVLVTAGLAIASFYTSVAGIVKAEMFPIELRALGVGLSYAIANALFGGSAEYVALALKRSGEEPMFYAYVTVMLLIAFAASLQLPRRPRYLHDGEAHP